ncbi:DNA-binding transcriptional LysR family regulator [Desulfitispora alkaliphila]|uniref:LysR substrate-binding domain-containing protein n=1 Tax=Desulfitispora alkaliphila TaxID=622674 RepID=UPI003D25E27F
MNRNQLEVFLNVARTKKISSAAKLLHLTQPAVSTQIKALENYFQTPLFIRSKKGVELTEAGQVVQNYAKKILQNFDSMEQEVDYILGVENQKLTIGATETVGNYAIPCSIWTFRDKYPNAQISLKVGSLSEIVRDLEEGKIDLAVMETVTGVDTKEFNLKDASSDEIIVIRPKDDKYKHLENIFFEQLKEYPFILPAYGFGIRESLEFALEQGGLKEIDLNVISELGSLEAIKSSVKAGYALSICSKMAVQKELHDGDLVEVRLVDLVMPITFKVVYPESNFLSTIAHRFLRFIATPDELTLCE